MQGQWLSDYYTPTPVEQSEDGVYESQPTL